MSAGTFAAAQLLRFLPRVRVSRAVGKLCDASIPAALSSFASRIYVRAYEVNLEEALAQQGAYPSFDAFFTRRLKEGVRPIAPVPVVSPADGMLASKGPVVEGGRIFVKGQPYDVGELTGDNADMVRYVGGEFAVVYLSPRDYHRVHSPVSGTLVEARSIAGDLYPVNAIGERHVPGLFVRNHRVAIILDTEALGRVTLVMVGATIVGRITVTGLSDHSTAPGLHRFTPGVPVAQGDEIGVFHLGSTVVLLLQAGLTINKELGRLLYGQALVRG